MFSFDPPGGLRTRARIILDGSGAALTADGTRGFLATHHDFVMLNALAGTPASKAAIQLASEKLIACLYR
jgi:hypothetical protein